MLDPTANPGGQEMAAHFTRPQTVAIVALGGSAEAFVREQMTSSRMRTPYDEVWTLNRGIRSFMHDKLFALDDLRWLAKRDAAYGEFLKKHTTPIVTSTVYPEFPSSIAYPYAEVLNTIEDDVFNVNTVSYMVAYAITIGVKSLTIFGADFCYPNGNHAEFGGQAVTYLLGLGKGKFGMEFNIPGSSTLLYANKVRDVGQGRLQRPPYGYHRRAELTEEERGIDGNQAPAAIGGAAMHAEQNQKRKKDAVPARSGTGLRPDGHGREAGSPEPVQAIREKARRGSGKLQRAGRGVVQ